MKHIHPEILNLAKIFHWTNEEIVLVQKLLDKQAQ